MLSVCVPIYNYDMRETVAHLEEQASQLPVPCEITCLDDGSDESCKAKNASLAALPHVRYAELPQNVGRARVRNLLAEEARYEYLLFLDCDSIVPDGFLAAYEALLQTKPQVVCGGRLYAASDSDRQHLLRYRYGVERESKRADVRSREPYRSFMTNNFLVRRDVLQAIPFDESITRYGHEDTLFGYRLMQAHIPIQHIENPVVNGDVETNAIFLHKTQEGVRSLCGIYRRMGADPDFVSQVSLLRFYTKVRCAHLLWLVSGAFTLFRKSLEWGFTTGRCTNMRLFSFYKLGLFARLERHPES